MKNNFMARFEDNVAVMVNPDSIMRFQACIEGLAANFNERELAAANEGDDDFWFEETDWRSRLRPYVVKNSILHIPVKGVLLHDFSYQYFDYATGYVYIEQAFRRGLADDNVKGIALVIDSPGGEVAGNFALVDKIYGWRGEKPIKAFASESAYSAAYNIAGAADSITVPRTGGLGSIGVVTSHVDISKMLDAEGYKITFIHAGAHKVDGNPYEPLKPEVKERIQKRIDGLYAIFVTTVARNRGMEEDAVRATEALTYSAPDAVEIGLADAIGELDESLTAFAVELEEGNETMANALTEADLEKAKAEGFAAGKAEGHTAGKTEGHAAGKAEGEKIGATAGATAEREKITAVLESEEGKKRPVAALALALEGDGMSSESIIKVLGKLPEEKASAPAAKGAKNETAEGFKKVMNAGGNPDVGEAGEEDADATASDKKVNATLAHFPKPKHAA